MKIQLVAGDRKPDLVEKIQEILACCMEEPNYFYWDELEQLEECYGLDAVIDALYYAQEENEEMLHDQEDYFLELLRHDEFEFYAKRMMGITNENIDW